MPIYRQNFQKTVWGYFEVEANSKKDTIRKFEDADYDEIDNKSEYIMGEWESD